MNNKYIEQIKKLLRNFQEESANTQQRIAQGKNMYNKETLDALTKDENEKLRVKRDEAEEQILKIIANVSNKVQAWAKLDGNKINDADMKLLDGSFDLTPEQFAEIADREMNNYTMQQALCRYATAHKIGYQPVTAEARINAYTQFGKKAIDILRLLENAPESATVKAEIELYGPQDSIYVRILGDGTGL